MLRCIYLSSLFAHFHLKHKYLSVLRSCKLSLIYFDTQLRCAYTPVAQQSAYTQITAGYFYRPLSLGPGASRRTLTVREARKRLFTRLCFAYPTLGHSERRKRETRPKRHRPDISRLITSVLHLRREQVNKYAVCALIQQVLLAIGVGRK